MSKKPCLDCGVVTENSRCPAHEAQRQTNNPRVRLNANDRGYSADWQRIRLGILARDSWICQRCGKRMAHDANATVDHVVPLSLGGARLDPTNLVACCRRCNSAKKDRIG